MIHRERLICGLALLYYTNRENILTSITNQQMILYIINRFTKNIIHPPPPLKLSRFPLNYSLANDTKINNIK